MYMFLTRIYRQGCNKLRLYEMSFAWNVQYCYIVFQNNIFNAPQHLYFAINHCFKTHVYILYSLLIIQGFICVSNMLRVQLFYLYHAVNIVFTQENIFEALCINRRKLHINGIMLMNHDCLNPRVSVKLLTLFL